MPSTPVIDRPISDLRLYPGNARTHSKKQIRQIADSIERFGFTNPVLVSDAGEIIAGHGRVAAAKLLGMISVPTLALSHLSEAERRAYVLADNKLALNAGWDQEMLAIELQGLMELDFDVSVTGFSLAEIDLALEGAADSRVDWSEGPEDVIPALSDVPVTRRGDIILDAFGGSGATLIAAHKTGRTARLMEYDPRYCDTIIRRFEAYTGKAATLAATGEAFEDLAEERRAIPEPVNQVRAK